MTLSAPPTTPSRRRAILAALALLFTAPAGLRARAARPLPLDLVAFDPPVPAPGFALPDLGGTEVRLDRFQGRHVLLNFWATWCPPCLKEMPSMERLHRRYDRARFSVVAVSTDREGEAVVGPYVARLGITFPILLDPGNRVGARYGARDLPSSFLLDPRRRIVAAAKGERDWSSAAAYAYIDRLVGER